MPNDYQVDGAWFGAIMCALLFVHFTMTALVQVIGNISHIVVLMKCNGKINLKSKPKQFQADLTAVDKINEEEINEWMLEELEIISAKPAFEHNKF